MTALSILTSAGYQDTHWGKLIIPAEKRGEFTGFDKYKRCEMWDLCACGKLDKRIPRTKGVTEQPIDSKLYKKGMHFSNMVYGDNFTKAAHTLIAIEKRAAEVLDDV